MEMAKQLVLTRKHKMTLVDLLNGAEHIGLVDTQTIEELVTAGLITADSALALGQPVYSNVTLTKAGVSTAQDLNDRVSK